MKEAELSPEAFAEMLGVSGMTIRRWMKAGKGQLPKLYTFSLRQACLDLIAQGKVDPLGKTAQLILEESGSEYHDNARTHLGLRPESAVFDPEKPEGFLESLFEIGAQGRQQAVVLAGTQQFNFFRKKGKEWTTRIDLLWRALKSGEISTVDKFAAFGALFYLLTPFDFVPDQLPMFGLMDDFLILGIAAAFYRKRFSHILAREK